MIDRHLWKTGWAYGAKEVEAAMVTEDRHYRKRHE